MKSFNDFLNESASKMHNQWVKSAANKLGFM